MGIDQRVRLCIGLDRWVKAVYRFKQMGQARLCIWIEVVATATGQAAGNECWKEDEEKV